MTKKAKRNLWIGVSLVVITALIAWTVINGRNKQKGVAVQIEEAATRRIEERVSASGRIFPVIEVAISSDVSGEIIELLVKEGDSVKLGQVLARIDPDAYQSQVSSGQAQTNVQRASVATAKAAVLQADADRKSAGVERDNAKQSAERTRQLVEEGILSEAELQTAESALATAEASLESAEARYQSSVESVKGAEYGVQNAEALLNVQRTSLNRTNVIAPMTGVVSLLSVEQGERVVGTAQMTGTEMMRLADLSQMEVEVEVSENDIPRVDVGDPVDVEVDAYLDRTFAGKVTEISNSANNLLSATGTRTLTTDQVTNFVVTVGIDAASYADLVSERRPYPFRPGMSAAVEVLTSVEAEALSVPIAAVTAREKEGRSNAPRAKQVANDSEAERNEDDLEELVWVVTAADTVARRPVKTGIQDRDYIMVTSGLKAGERLVAGPYSAISRRLKSGDEVYQEDASDDAEESDDTDD